jgi:hypothetical protein
MALSVPLRGPRHRSRVAQLCVRRLAPHINMLCNICQEREATVHTTIISGDVLRKGDLCEECFKASNPTQAHELTTALKAGCQYCGGEPFTGSGHSLDGLSGTMKPSFMCKPCAQEYSRLLRLKMPGFGSDTLTKEQAAKLAQYDFPAIFAEAEEHMKKWVAERDSQ